MGRYDDRFGSQAETLRHDPDEAENPAILAWWGPEHDQALRDCIQDFQWSWQFRAADYVLARVDDATLEAWVRADRRVTTFTNPTFDATRNLRIGCEGPINGFAWARGHVKGFTDAIRPSRTVPCARCGHRFEEWSLPDNYIERLGVNQLDICSPCLRDSLMLYAGGRGDDYMTTDAVRAWVAELVRTLGRIPPQNVGYDDKGTLLALPAQQRVRMLDLLGRRPSRHCIKDRFGSWLGALQAAGVLEADAQQMMRGIRSIASDGHVCQSLGERTICELLAKAQIHHEREVPYPEGGYRADFRIGGTLVEYLGLDGDPAYDAKTKAKQAACRRLAVPLILVRPRDLGDLRALELRLRRALKE